MAYGHVYVAQVAMGANPNQVIKAMLEAESYDGPSLIICYAPCAEHGIKGGLSNHQATQRKAVECGYFIPYRFDPRLEKEGKNPFQLDSKEPTADFKEFITSEVRYNRLMRSNPERAEALFNKAAEDAKKKYDALAAKAGK